MRALVHFGLAAVLVLAPAFCCCNVWWLAGPATASAAPAPACPSCPEPAAALAIATPVKKACCHEVKPELAAPVVAAESAKPTQPAPASPQCKCLGERPDATPPESAPVVADPESIGELLPVASLVPAAVPPEHLGLLGGLDPPERAGVDARSESLFSRHVLRC